MQQGLTIIDAEADGNHQKDARDEFKCHTAQVEERQKAEINKSHHKKYPTTQYATWLGITGFRDFSQKNSNSQQGNNGVSEE